jgi:hypothetical protein
MKKLMYLSISILCLSISALIGFHLGTGSVQAQNTLAPGGYALGFNPNSTYWYHFVMTETGDMYIRHSQGTGSMEGLEPAYLGNYWELPPVPTNQNNWGQIKGEYKGK